MGRQMEYTRRKRDAACFNGEKMERVHTIKNCVCTQMDWECDFSHFRSISEDGKEVGACKKLFDINATALMEQACSVGDKYHIPNGYRKVAGDSCVGGVNHAPHEYHCHYVRYILNIC